MIDLRKIETHSIKYRKSKVKVKDFSKLSKKGFSLDLFPDILAGRDLKEILKAILKAKKKKKHLIFGMGAHIIKTGLSPIIIDLIKKNVITGVVLNGAGMIHDVEISLFGETSENVEEGLKFGNFGMVKETNDFINFSISESPKNVGLGEWIGKRINETNPKYKNYSILFNSYLKKIPATVHIAIGTDINNIHPSFNPSKAAEMSYLDFKKLMELMSDLSGGVLINAGSAVILPEVFLKVFAILRNLKYELKDFTCVNLDFIRQYRGMQQIVERVKIIGGKGYNITCHHEIIIPLLYKFIVENI
jgi:hypothetical protein